MTEDLTGRQVGDYRLIELIGSGGMGDVYRAEHVHQGQTCAVKVLPAELAADKDFVARFHDETRVMADLRHPGIVQIQYMGVDDGVYFLAMDYVPGPALDDAEGLAPRADQTGTEQGPVSLHDYLRAQGGRLPADQVRRWAVQIAEALAYAHGKGVVHRDIKPANIVLDGASSSDASQANTKLTDLGLAEVIGGEFILSRIQTTTRPPSDGEAPSDPGAADYRAPEQRGKGGGAIDARSDVYALGVLLYRMLTGTCPAKRPKAVAKIVLGLSKKWDVIIDRCLEADPADRYASADDLLADLRDLDSARRPRHRHGRPHGRRIAVPVMVALAAAIVAAALWLADPGGPSGDGLDEAANNSATAPGTPADIIPLRTEAIRAWGGVKSIDRGQGFGDLLDKADITRANAEAFYGKDAYSEAKAAYDALAATSRELAKLDADRTEALAARGSVLQARAAADTTAVLGDAPTEWDRAERLATKADASFEDGLFTEAQTKWEKAGAAYVSARELAARVASNRQAAATAKTACQGAKGEARFENAHIEAPAVWKAAEQSAKAAAAASDQGRHARAKQLWGKAAEGYDEARTTAKRKVRNRRDAQAEAERKQRQQEAREETDRQTRQREARADAERQKREAREEAERKQRQADGETVKPDGRGLSEAADRGLRTWEAAYPDLATYLPEWGMIRLSADLLFGPGSDVVSTEGREALRRLATLMKADDELMRMGLLIAGHSDTTPIENPSILRRHPNKTYLSIHRALSVADRLRKQSVPADRLACVGFGGHRPLLPSDAGHPVNRRVEMWFVPSGTPPKLGASEWFPRLAMPARIQAELQRWAGELGGNATYSAKGSVIHLKNSSLFKVGSDEISSSGTIILTRLARIASNVDSALFVASHARGGAVMTPEMRRRHPTPLHLAVHRSISVCQTLKKTGLRSLSVAPVGFPGNPAGSRKTSAEGTAANRWVEFRFAPSSALTTRAMAAMPATQPKPTEAPEHLTLDCGGGVEMTLVRIPAGEFMMGSPADEQGHGANESPVHRVQISTPFHMGVTEVSQAQYRAVMGRNPSDHKGAGRPVENVSWDDAVAFCRAMSAKTGKTVRLPTEAQWEYACRAGSTTRFSFGNAGTALHQYGNCAAASRSDGHDTTAPVGSYKPNAWGLYDMHGNVWEWCQDWYDDKHYADAGNRDPQGPSRGSLRVLRGGAWDIAPRNCRSANRRGGASAGQGGRLGFRVAVSLAEGGDSP